MIFALQIGHRPFQPFHKVVALNGVAGGGFLVAKHTLVKHHLAQHHFRMVNKIGVQRNAALCLFNGNPWAVIFIRHNFPFPLLQKKNISGRLGSRHLFERIVREPDCPQQFRPLCQIPAHLGICLVHGVLGGNDCHNTARTHLIQRLCKKIIVDTEVIAVIARVVHPDRIKGDIPDDYIKEVVWIAGLFKAFYLNLRLRVKLFCDCPGDRVQLHTVQLGILHGFRQHGIEVACSHGRV